MKTFTLVLAAVLLSACAAGSVGSLRGEIADSLARQNEQIQSYASAKQCAKAKQAADKVVADLDRAIAQAAAGKPISLQILSAPHVVATPEDTTWLIERKEESVSLEHTLEVDCIW